MSKCEWEVHAIESGGREESGECRGEGACIFRMVRCRGHNISFLSGGVRKVLLLFIINIASSHSFPRQ